LFLAGVALIASIFVPFRVAPSLQFSWSAAQPMFSALIWPILSGGAYLLLTVAPADLRQKIPPIVLHWLPFSVAYAGVFISHMGLGELGEMGVGVLYIAGYSTLVFGLLARIAQPQDQVARIVIAVGAALLVIPFFKFFDLFRFMFDLGIIFGFTFLLWMVVVLLGILCVVFVVPPHKLPPALQAIDAIGPLVAAILLAWLPLQMVMLFFAGLIHPPHEVVSGVLMLAHSVLPIVAYFGVLMMAAPSAYEEAKALFVKGPGGPPAGGGYPPAGGGYPPQGGGYPPQQGGWQ
jgi:hypothetical protein